MITKILKILSLLFITVLFSCEKYADFPGCSDCVKDEPSTVQLEFKLDFTYGVPVKVDIYDGLLSDSILYASYTLSQGEVKYRTALNKMVTATATYVINNTKYTVVDSRTPGVTLDKNHCADPCYFVYDYKLDLRLKYIKN